MINNCQCQTAYQPTAAANNDVTTTQNQTGSNSAGLGNMMGDANMMLMLLQLIMSLLQQFQGQQGQGSGDTNTGNTNTGNTNTGNTNTGNTNTGNTNTGNTNTGNTNTGNTNTGNTNTGNTNTGNTNTGNTNTGNTNTGNTNTGDTNTGNTNTGNTNTGNTNTGDTNTGNTNTGDTNTGDTNTGNTNTGNTNTGNTNTGNTNTGGTTTTPECETQPAPNPVGIDDGSKIWGDPHFVGAEGGKYDVQGEDGKTYNILSDQNLQINSTFASWGGNGATVMGTVGATIGQDQVEIQGNGDLSINGEAKSDGTYNVDGGTVTKEGKNVTMKTEEYAVTAKSASGGHGSYLNLDFASDNVNADGIMPHGLWGQTADGDGEARQGDRGAGAQGGGAIEKLDGSFSEKGDKETVELYETAGLFDTGFGNFNQFNG